MLQIATAARFESFQDADLSTAGSRLERLAETFCDMVLEARRQKILRQYAVRNEITVAPRGVITFPKQITNNFRRPGAFSSRWVELSQNCVENRYLKTALEFCVHHTSGRVRKRLDQLLVEFETVAVSDNPNSDFATLVLDRLPTPYQRALRLARDILNGSMPGLYSGTTSGRSEVTFLPDLFERFIARLGEQVATRHALKSRAHARGRYFGRWDNYNERSEVIELIPDVELHTATAAAASLVIDAKWKPLSVDVASLGIDRDDIFQVATYARRLNCRRAMLAYPWMGDADPLGGPVTATAFGQDLRICVLTVPLLWGTLVEATNNFVRSTMHFMAS